MDVRRARFLAGPTLFASMLALAFAAPVAAADCALTAPAAVNVGDSLTIVGSGFPAAADVDFALSVDGTEVDSFTIQSDATGSLQLSLTPEDVDIGSTHVVATAGTACTAEVSYLVLAVGQTLPTPEPVDEALPTAPRTDALGGPGTGGGANWLTAALALVLLAVGAGGLALTRGAGRR